MKKDVTTKMSDDKKKMTIGVKPTNEKEMRGNVSTQLIVDETIPDQLNTSGEELPTDMYVNSEKITMEVVPGDDNSKKEEAVTNGVNHKIGDLECYYFCKIFTSISQDDNEMILAFSCVNSKNDVFYAEVTDFNFKKINTQTFSYMQNILALMESDGIEYDNSIITKGSLTEVSVKFKNWIEKVKTTNKIVFSFWNTAEMRYLMKIFTVAIEQENKIPSTKSKIYLPPYVSPYGFSVAQEVSTSMEVYKAESGEEEKIYELTPPFEFVVQTLSPGELVSSISWYNKEDYFNHELIYSIPILLYSHCVKVIFDLLFVKGN